MILPASLPPHVAGQQAGVLGTTRRDNGRADGVLPEGGIDLEQHVKEIERDYIAQALKRAGGVKVKAAGLLGMSFRSLRYYTKKYKL